MADQKLSELTAATTIGSTDLVYAVIGGNSRRITRDNFTTSLALGSLTSNIGTSGTISSTSTVTGTKLIPTGNVTAGNGMYLPATNAVAFSTNGSERMRILAGGNVGIGLTAPNELLEVNGNIHVSGGDRTIFNRSNNSLAFGTNNAAAFTIPASGVIVTTRSILSQVSDGTIECRTLDGGFCVLSRARGSFASPTALQTGDLVGGIQFRAHDGTSFAFSGVHITYIAAENQTPTNRGGDLRFSTTAIGSASSSSRMRIMSSGQIGIATDTPNASAQVDVVSTTRGFLPPRMTGTQRDAISTPAAGLIVYNTTTNKLNFYNGSAWRAVDDSAV